MAEHRVVCTEQMPMDEPTSHAHIVVVGTGADPDHATGHWTLAGVISSIGAGNVFYTISPSTGKKATVRVVPCSACGHQIIKSSADAVTDNNLDSLRRCN